MSRPVMQAMDYMGIRILSCEHSTGMWAMPPNVTTCEAGICRVPTKDEPALLLTAPTYRCRISLTDDAPGWDANGSPL